MNLDFFAPLSYVHCIYSLYTSYIQVFLAATPWWTQCTSFGNLVLQTLVKWFSFLHFPHLHPWAGHSPLFPCSDPHLVHSANFSFYSLLKHLLWSPRFFCLDLTICTLGSSPTTVCSWAQEISWVLTMSMACSRVRSDPSWISFSRTFCEGHPITAQSLTISSGSLYPQSFTSNCRSARNWSNDWLLVVVFCCEICITRRPDSILVLCKLQICRNMFRASSCRWRWACRCCKCPSPCCQPR